MKLPTIAVGAFALLLLVAPHAPAVAGDDTPSVFGVDLGVDLPWTRVSTEAAVFEAPRYGSDARLFVRDGDRWRVYRGSNYQTIVKDRPELGANAGLEILGQKLSTNMGIDADRDEFPTLQAGIQSYARTPNMTYETSSLNDRSRLYVTEDNREYVYVGSDLNAIVASNPKIKEMDNYEVLNKRVAALPTWRVKPKSSTSSHLEVWNNKDGYTVRSWTHADGKWKRSEASGATLAAIVEKNPELATSLTTWSDETWTKPAAHQSLEAFGLVLKERAHQDGTFCVVVHEVMKDTPAATANIAAGDIIVTADGQKLTSLMRSREVLDSADADVALHVRRGKNARNVTLMAKPTTVESK